MNKSVGREEASQSLIVPWTGSEKATLMGLPMELDGGSLTTERELLQIQSLTVWHRDKMILDSVSFSLYEGEIVSLVGVSGSGKTTLLRTLLGLWGRGFKVSCQGYIGGSQWPIEKSLWRYLRGNFIGFIPQNAAASLVPGRTVGEQWKEIAVAHGLSSQTYRAQYEFLTESLGLPKGVERLYSHELSGGMAQRVAIGAALLPKPKILLADEPTASLDLIGQQRVCELLRPLPETLHCAVLLVTHQPWVARCLAQRCYRLEQGRLWDC